MADKDNDGISDNVDIDGGTGTNQAATPSLDAQEAATLQAYLGQFPGFASLGAPETPTSTTQSNTSTSVTRLTYDIAKTLLQKTMEQIGFNGKLSAADIKDFMQKFETAQNKQIQKVVTTSSTKTVPGATADATKKVIDSTARQEFPSLFDPAEFTKDYIYTKIDFKNEASLGAKQLDALGDVRGLINKFQLLGVGDADMRLAAKQIAMGKKTIADYTVELQQIAKREYPQFADRFNMDPTLTTYDIASPVINMLAKTWQKDPKEIKMDNPYVMSYLNYAGPDGKGKQPSYYDLLLKAKNDPQYELTEQANEDARDAAVGLARAFGFGV
jgi:hypothetical protein